MFKRIWRLVKKLGRPKTGQKRFSHSLSLEMKHKEFLNKHPNGSKLVRDFLDELIASSSEEVEVGVIVLKRKIDMLNQELDEASEEYGDYVRRHERETYEEGQRLIWDFEVSNWKLGTVKDTREAKLHHKVLNSLWDKMEVIRGKIKELETEILET